MHVEILNEFIVMNAASMSIHNIMIHMELLLIVAPNTGPVRGWSDHFESIHKS